MNGKRYVGIALFAAWACVAGCAQDGATKGEARPAGKPPVAVDFAKAAASDLTESIDVVGTLSPKFQAEIKPEYGGVVTDVYVTEWAQVKKGVPLMRIDGREGQVIVQKAQASLDMAGASLLEAEASAARADRELERAGKLKDAGLITQQGMDDARTQKEASAARVKAAKAQVAVAQEDVRHAKTRLSKAVIAMPFDGTVAERLVNVGDLVGEMQKVVFRVVDNRLLDLTATVPSGEMAGVRVGQPISFTSDAAPGKEFTGRITYINPSVNPADRSVRVVAEVPNASCLLRGGLFVKGRIVTGKRANVLQVPRSALASWDVTGKKGEVLVVLGGVARSRAIGTGLVRGEAVEVVSGLSAGDVVVTRGLFNIKDGDAVKAAANGGK